MLTVSPCCSSSFIPLSPLSTSIVSLFPLYRLFPLWSLFGVGLDINSHQRGGLPKYEEHKVLSAPGFGENPSGEGPSGQESTCPGKGLWILPKCGSQAPESEEETSSRVRAPPLTTANPDSDFAEEKASSCSEGVIRRGRGRASPGSLPLRGLMLCNFSGWPRLLKTAEAQLIKCIFTVEII